MLIHPYIVDCSIAKRQPIPIAISYGVDQDLRATADTICENQGA
jgi:hypothetical protein